MLMLMLITHYLPRDSKKVDKESSDDLSGEVTIEKNGRRKE